MFNSSNPNIKCAGAVFVSHDDQAIVFVFRYSQGNDELSEQEYFYNVTAKFPGGGTVHNFYYNAFNVLWNGGLKDAFFTAKNAYPTYELWLTGYSLGGALTSIAAPYITYLGYFDKDNTKVVNFGAPRVGHQDFVDRFPSLVSYAYRVVHRNDIVPHGFQNVSYINYANEIWYNNNMQNGDPYIECDTVESLNCSDSVPENLWTWNDHNYFDDFQCIKFTNPPKKEFE